MCVYFCCLFILFFRYLWIVCLLIFFLSCYIWSACILFCMSVHTLFVGLFYVFSVDSIKLSFSDLFIFFLSVYRLLASGLDGAIYIWDRRSSNFPCVELNAISQSQLNSIQVDTENRVSRFKPYFHMWVNMQLSRYYHILKFIFLLLTTFTVTESGWHFLWFTTKLSCLCFSFHCHLYISSLNLSAESFSFPFFLKTSSAEMLHLFNLLEIYCIVIMNAIFH